MQALLALGVVREQQAAPGKDIRCGFNTGHKQREDLIVYFGFTKRVIFTSGFKECRQNTAVTPCIPLPFDDAANRSEKDPLCVRVFPIRRSWEFGKWPRSEHLSEPVSHKHPHGLADLSDFRIGHSCTKQGGSDDVGGHSIHFLDRKNILTILP
ncbi:hypothetical protein RIF23_20315 [Lipingzhangella sp. LS1_29]|uniref:Uncharacterized protein n=1 Tax=Lipingzhangella rawalii TaxID=2055835 RepID=A0ABU2HBC4_9ACTN|nr:hypothetical protein [Lipingzhangella rawalii]MDS1272635.1 hypothetical protein [Lipingzhangella rawalii]